MPVPRSMVSHLPSCFPLCKTKRRNDINRPAKRKRRGHAKFWFSRHFDEKVCNNTIEKRPVWLQKRIVLKNILRIRFFSSKWRENPNLCIISLTKGWHLRK